MDPPFLYPKMRTRTTAGEPPQDNPAITSRGAAMRLSLRLWARASNTSRLPFALSPLTLLKIG